MFFIKKPLLYILPSITKRSIFLLSTTTTSNIYKNPAIKNLPLIMQRLKMNVDKSQEL
jgi:hypothetical protein